MRTHKLTALSLIALAISASSATSAFAQNPVVQRHGEVDAVLSQPFVSQTSRAAVLSDLQQSVATIVSGEAGGRISQPGSTLSRADVRTETRAASARGEIRHGDALVAVVATPAGAQTLGVNSVTRPYLSGGQAALQHGEADGYGVAVISSTRTRADVKAELQQAVAHGEILNGEAYLPATVSGASSRTRAEVIAEVRQAMAKGELSQGDLYGPRTL